MNNNPSLLVAVCLVCLFGVVIMPTAWAAGNGSGLKNEFGEHKFLAACREGYVEGVWYYMNLPGFDINQLYPGGESKRPMTGLYLAAGYGHHSVVTMLLANGANPNVRVYGGNTPLINAAEVGHEDVIQTLINYGAEVDAKNDDNDSATYLASKGGFEQVGHAETYDCWRYTSDGRYIHSDPEEYHGRA